MTSWPERSEAPESLLAHRQWVRELARRLCADQATADDLEQQTWLAALQSPPRHGGAPKAWLGTVLRSWLHKMRRGEGRRSRRERDSARSERTPSTAEIVAEAEAHRRVVDAVFTLDEPLRTTMLLRFFEDLPIAEVATRTAVPLETAKSRVKRALELLRAQLDRNPGGRRAWVLALAPLVQAAPVGMQVTFGAVLQALLMNTTHKLMITGALLLGSAAAYLITTQSSPAPIDLPGTGGTATAPGDPVAANADARSAEAGTRAAVDREAVPVTVLVRTWSDAPIEGASVEACTPPSGGEGNDYERPTPVVTAKATTDAQGSVHFTNLAAGRWHFYAAKEGCCRSGAPDVLLKEGTQPGPVVIRLGAGHALEGRVFTADGRAVSGASVTALPTSSSLVRPRTTSDGQGHYRLESLRAGPTLVAAGLPGGKVSVVDTIQVPEVTSLDIVLRTGGILVGKVSDQKGQPIAGARVRVQTTTTGYYKSTTAEAVSSAQGRYRIDTLGEGLIHEVTATKEGLVQVADAAGDNFDQAIPFRDGATWTRDIVMGPGGRLLVSVRGPKGPVAGAQVSVQQASRNAPRPRVITDAQGQARFNALAPLRTLVSVHAFGLHQPDQPANPWSVMNDPTSSSPYLVEMREEGEATLEITLAKAAVITGRVLGPDDQGLAGVLVNFANAADKSSAATTVADGSFRMPGRPGATPLAITKDGYVPVGATVAEVPESGDLQDLVLRMAVAPRVRGTVRSAGRLGEAFVQVAMVPDREQEWQEQFRWANTERMPIATDGSYDLALPRGEGRFAVHAVALQHPSATSSPLRIVPGQDSYTVDLELEEGHTLTGRVVALGSGEGVPGARLRGKWYPADTDISRMIHGPETLPVLGTGDHGGRFLLQNLRAGRWQVTATAEGFLEESTEVRLPQEGEVQLALPAELSIEGVVQYPDGRPVAAAQLMPYPQPGNRNLGMGIDQISMSAPDGHFKLPRLQAGHYRIDVVPPRTGSANFRRMETGIVSAPTRELRIVVEPGAMISGRVVDGSGRPLGSIAVGARGPNDERASVETLLDGTFKLVGLEDGAVYNLMVNASGGQRTKPYASLQRPHVPTGTTGLEFVLEPGLSISGQVVDQAGIAVPSLEISAAPIGTNDPYGPVAWTDQSGSFTIQGLPPGHFRLSIPPWFSRGLLLSGGDDVTAGASGIKLTASEGAKISGFVVDETGAPLQGVEVSTGGSWTRSRKDGAFDLPGLAPGTPYDVTARVSRRVPASQRGVPAGSKDLRLVLARGMEVQGRLLDGTGQPLAGINLRLVHNQTGQRVTARTGNDGSFTAMGMTPGNYAVEASMGNATRLLMVPCGNVDAGQREVELRLRQ